MRVPDGLKPGDEFIFEVLASVGGYIIDATNSATKGGTTKKGGTANSSIGGGGPEKSSSANSNSGNSKKKQPSSKNPKKKSNNDSSSSKDQLSHIDNGGAPSFVVGFFQLYKQVYDALTQDTTLPSSASPSSRQQNAKNSNQRSQSNSQLGQMQQGTAYRLGFLDREIVNGKDFLTALAVGMFIGLSIVLGFLAGVLAVTPIT